MSELGLFVAGDSVLHRLKAGPKLLALAVAMSLFTWLASPLTTTVGLAVVVLLGGLSRVGARSIWAQVKPLRWMLGLIVVLQLILAGPLRAYVVGGGIVVAVLSAALVTLTTPTQDLLDAMVRVLGPLRRVGVDPERIALLLALTIRAVPVLATIVEQTRQARLARGAQRSATALLFPVALRTVRYADQLGEALVARGLDD